MKDTLQIGGIAEVVTTYPGQESDDDGDEQESISDASPERDEQNSRIAVLEAGGITQNKIIEEL